MNYEQKHPIMCPFCRRVVHIETQDEDVDKVITVKCVEKNEFGGGLGPGCGRSFRSYCFFKIKTGAIEPFQP